MTPPLSQAERERLQRAVDSTVFTYDTAEEVQQRIIAECFEIIVVKAVREAERRLTTDHHTGAID